MQKLNSGAIIYAKVYQADITAPFEAWLRLPGSRFQVLAKDRNPVRDVRGLLLTPEVTIRDCPDL